MKRLRTLTGLLAICGMSVFMTGCGGDDDDDNGGPQGPVQNAPNSLANSTYTLTDSSGTSTLSFGASGNSYTLSRPGSATESGTYSATRSGDTWNVTTTDGTMTSVVTLSFSSGNSGQFTLQRPGADAITGNFARQASSGTGDTSGGTTTTGGGTSTDGGTTTTGGGTSTDGGTTTTGGGTSTDGGTTTTDGGTTTTDGGTTTTDGGSTTSGGSTTGGGTTTTTGGDGTAPAPAALARMEVTNTQSGTGPSSYTIEFSGTTSGTFMISNGSVGQGTFTYAPSGNNARLVLTYTDFPGDSDDMNLAFRSASTGTHSGSQVVSGTTYTINGTFTYVPQ